MTAGLPIRVEGLVRRFGAIRAVDGVDLQARPGGILGIVGPNGAGKSTLMNLLSGLDRPDHGQIWAGDLPLHRLPAHRIAELGIARTFQIVKPLRELTVLENVMVGALFGRRRCREMRIARGIAATELARVGLDHKASAECRNISTGEAKRLDLARALAMDPQVLLLDEPLAGVGQRESARLIDIIVATARAGVTVILVEHVMRAVWSIADRVLVLQTGRKIADGPPDEVSRDEAVIAAYLGARWTRTGTAT